MNQVGDLIRIDESGERLKAKVEKRSDMTILTKNEGHYKIVFAGKKVFYTNDPWCEDEREQP